VKDLTWEELSKLDVGSWKGGDFVGRRVSKLADVFKVMRGKPERHLYLDIKNVDFEKLAELVKKFGVEKQVILATPKYSVIQQWSKLVPGSDTLLWMGGTEEDKRKTLAELRKANFAGVTQVQAHTRLNTNSASADLFTPSNQFFLETGKELRERGILFQALPWDISDPKRYWQLFDLGVMSFSTDYPDVVMEGLREYYQQTRKPVTKPQ
jgi:glycerophosphoryl diester phosphodiesterase